MNCPNCNDKDAAEFKGLVRVFKTKETTQLLEDLLHDRVKWNEEYREKFTPLIRGKYVSGYLANFCGCCGTDMRPYHEQLMKSSGLKPLPKYFFIKAS